MTVTAQILDQIVEVRRVEDGQFTNVEPEFDGTWPKLTKLEWQCAVVELDCGIRPRVSAALLHVNGIPQPDHFCIAVGGSSISPLSFLDAWTYLNGVAAGVMAARAGGKGLER